jgi:uncharacterized Tic20 family protein
MNIDAALPDRTAREDRLVAALCHASAMIPLMGAMVPLAIWLSQRERSPLLRFQAAQALAYQLCGLLAYFLLIACQFLSMFAMFPVPFLMEAIPPGGLSPGETSTRALIVIFFSLVFFGGVLLIMAAYFLGGPLFILVALVGSGRVLDGHDFHYPVLGKMITRWLEKIT